MIYGFGFGGVQTFETGRSLVARHACLQVSERKKVYGKDDIQTICFTLVCKYA